MGIGPLLLRVIWSFRDNMSPQSFAVLRVQVPGLSVDDPVLLSNQAEKSINFYFIRVPLRKKVLKYGTPKPRIYGSRRGLLHMAGKRSEYLKVSASNPAAAQRPQQVGAALRSASGPSWPSPQSFPLKSEIWTLNPNP